MRSSMLQAAGFDVQGQSFTSWEILQKALLHHGGERIINLLVGPGYHGAGSDWASTYLSPADSFDRFNLRGQRKQALRADLTPTLGQGAVLHDVLRCNAVHRGIGALAVRRPLSCVTLVTLATDAMSLAPALLTWTGTLQLIGAKEGPLSLERLLALPPDAALELNSSMMEYQFCTLATGQDSRQFDMPVAQWACTSGGGVAVAKERHKKVFGDMTACTVCIERAMAEGPGAKIVCEPTSDCESRELSLMKQPDLSGRAGVLTRGVPDIVHLLKSVRSAMYWWWLSFDGHLVCLRLLMVLRASEDVSVHAAMVKAVNAATLRNKDRDSAEIQPRYHRDIAEMRPRYGVRPRSRGEMWPMYGEIRPSTPRYG
mmetsp:Transcript_46259/g.150428  ORF Transcript_46259/g.150428 Transcript_46259/m.150428 type:complete len:371 (-) Transcript_46259:155-1267(-)